MVPFGTFLLAGVTGIEPVNGEFRVHCLTAWLHPNDYSLSAKRTSITPGTSSWRITSTRPLISLSA